MSNCPEEGTLRLIGSDVLGEATYAAIEQHVEDCLDCQAVLERLAHRRSDVTAEPLSLTGGQTDPGFEIQEKLDQGATSEVFLAKRIGLDRPVAIKVMPAGLGPEGGAVRCRRWLCEARAISRVRHPNVVPLYNFGAVDGWFYLVLEYIPGGTLKRRLTEPLLPRAAAVLMETIAHAVGHVHGQGLVHLDLKPSNILLDGECDGPWDRVIPRISDFGLSLAEDGGGLTETTMAGIRGTPSYMAPEQTAASRAGIGRPADIHAMGAILYHLLTGRPPFQGASTLETLDQVRKQEPVPPRRLNTKIPRDLETIALKCLEKSPSQRYASADAMADDLRRWLDGKPISARPVSPVGHAWRWCRRQPVIAALGVTLVAMVIGGVVGLTLLLRRSETQRLRAEGDYQAASQSLDDIMTTISSSIRYHYYDYKNTDIRKALEAARAREVQLSGRHPRDILSLKRLAFFDERLANFCEMKTELNEARLLLEEAAGCWELCLAIVPGDQKIRSELLQEISHLMITFVQPEHESSYQRWNSRALALLEKVDTPHGARDQTVLALCRRHRGHAILLASTGQFDRARGELEADLMNTRSVSRSREGCPVSSLNEALLLAAFGRWSDVSAIERSATRSKEHEVFHMYFEEGLAELTERRVGWLPSINNSTPPIPESLPTDIWASRVLSSIESDTVLFDFDRFRVPAIVWLMHGGFSTTLAHRRKSGQLDAAQRLADHLIELAKQLTRAYPTQALSYMVLSEAFVQKTKNAYQIDDVDPLPWERKALEAALHAVSLEPENEDAHNLLKDRLARLNKLGSPPRGGTPTKS